MASPDLVNEGSCSLYVCPNTNGLGLSLLAQANIECKQQMQEV